MKIEKGKRDPIILDRFISMVTYKASRIFPWRWPTCRATWPPRTPRQPFPARIQGSTCTWKWLWASCRRCCPCRSLEAGYSRWAVKFREIPWNFKGIVTVARKFTSASWRFDSAQLGSEFFRIITASITISTFGGGRVKDRISDISFLLNASSACITIDKSNSYGWRNKDPFDRKLIWLITN